ncbi:alpha/beta hydrolase [Rhodococcus rhodnii]|nr:alpha/beta hydrolase [Rhodococcus rhodnii]TXG90946.1 alpha/beta hydrolase [Rhodococcus rhodnii]
MVTALALPGTGSDALFAYRAFAPAMRSRGAAVVCANPGRGGVVAAYRTAIRDAVRRGPVLLCGISLGAVVALDWAREHPENVRGVLAALPPWTGDPDGTPAAASARHTAAALRTEGLGAVSAAMAASSPAWLAATLTRSWRSQWPALPDLLDEAATTRAPGADELAALTVPVAVAAATDDPVHPYAVARRWLAALPTAAAEYVTLDDVGADPSVLGYAAAAALDRITPRRR